MNKRKPKASPQRKIATKLDEDVHTNLLRCIALRMLQTGEKITISSFIQEMLDDQPVYQVTAEEIHPEPTNRSDQT